MSARPGGYASKAEQAQRLDVIRALWPNAESLTVIAQRVGLHPCEVAKLGRRAGLPPRTVGRPRKESS